MTTSVDGKTAGNTVVTRTHVQVLANSLAGTIFAAIHLLYTRGLHLCFNGIPGTPKPHVVFVSDMLVYGVIGYFPTNPELTFPDTMPPQQPTHGPQS